MKFITCLVLLGLMVAYASAAPGHISSNRADASSFSESHALGGEIGFGPLSFGGNINSASSKAHTRASSINHSPGYGHVSNYNRPEYIEPTYNTETHGSSSLAQSEGHSIGGGIGFGPFKIGANVGHNSAHAQAHSSAVNTNYDRLPRYVRNEYSSEYELGNGMKRALHKRSPNPTDVTIDPMLFEVPFYGY